MMIVLSDKSRAADGKYAVGRRAPSPSVIVLLHMHSNTTTTAVPFGRRGAVHRSAAVVVAIAVAVAVAVLVITVQVPSSSSRSSIPVVGVLQHMHGGRVVRSESH